MSDKRIYRTHLDKQVLQIEMQQLTGNTVILKLGDIAVLITGMFNHKQSSQLITINTSFNQPLLVNLLLEAFLNAMDNKNFSPVTFTVNVWGNANNVNLITLISMGLSILLTKMHLPLSKVLVALNVQAINLDWRLGENNANHLLLIGNHTGIVLIEGKFAALSREHVVAGIKYAYQQLLPLIKFIEQINLALKFSETVSLHDDVNHTEYHLITRHLLLSCKPHILPVSSAIWIYGNTQVITGKDNNAHHLLLEQQINLDNVTSFITNTLATLHLPLNTLATVTVNNDGNLLVTNVYADLLALRDDNNEITKPVYATSGALYYDNKIIINPTLNDEKDAKAIFNLAGYTDNLLALRIISTTTVSLVDVHAVLVNIDSTSKLL